MTVRLFLFTLLLNATALCQESVNLYFHVDKISFKEKARKDSTWFAKEKIQAIEQFRLFGYSQLVLTDSTVKKSTIHYYYSYGHHFDKVFLTCTNGNPKRKPKLLKAKDYQGVLNQIEHELELLENSGYPFCSLQITEQKEENDRLLLSYRIDSGAFFVMDEIYVKCKGKVDEKTISSLINIKPGDAYSESKIRDVETIIPKSKLYTLLRPPQLIFKNGRVDLYLFIEKKRSSNADGYIGFQQNPTTSKLALNGYINLRLVNALNRAEIMDLNWKNNPNKTQNLRAHFEYPFLFGLPIGIGTQINLQKQDTTFIKSDVFFDISYHHPRFTFTLFDEIERSDLISSIIPTGFRDYRKNTVGAKFVYEPKMPDYLSFYHPGIELMGGFFNYRADTLDNNKQKINNNKYKWQYNQTFDFLKYFHLNNSLSFQGLASSVALSRNEMIYFGGLKSVRGFYELELYGNDVWILNNSLEFRPIDIMSFSLIYDYSIFNNIGRHYTHSAGIGFALINETFTLQIIIANGVMDNNPVDLKNTKVHIGFTSNF